MSNNNIHHLHRSHVHFVDRPCGTGKTSEILRSFIPGRKYLVVVPLLSEVERIIRDASVSFVQPEDRPTKSDDLEALLLQGSNVVTTHRLFSSIGGLADRGLIDGYDVIIDEVLDVVREIREVPRPKSYREFYIDKGYVTENEDGLILPTEKWDRDLSLVSDTLKPSLYHLAKSRTLYRIDGSFFLWAMPPSVFRAGRSITVYTYLAEGSLMLAYLRKFGISYSHERYADEVRFRARVRDLIDIRSIPSIEDPRKGIRLSHTGQTDPKGRAARDKAISMGLRKLRERVLMGVDLKNVLITCAKENWFRGGDDINRKPGGFAKDSRIFESIWLPNTTRGTNDYAHASVCIYLYDQHLHPILSRWLGLAGQKGAGDRYAMAELIQWVFRSRVRKGEPITLFLPSARMRSILQGWLEGDDLTTKLDAVPLAA